MLTGQRAFKGEDVSDTLASVLKSDPDWSALPESTPFTIPTLIRRCLEKDRCQRVSDIAAALFILRDPTVGARSHDAVTDRTSRWRVAAVLLVTAAVTGDLLYRSRRVPDESTGGNHAVVRRGPTAAIV